MAGTIIPVFIHLWQRRPAKVLKVGSTVLLRESSLKHARSLHLTELLLLLVRCALIVLLAFLLAQPVWKKTMTANNGKGWVMVTGAEGYRYFKPAIDSLLHQGHALHYFNSSFEKVGADELKEGTDSTGYWQLLQQLGKKLPAGFPVYLFTDNRLEKIKSTRPVSALNLVWLVYTPADSVAEETVLQYPMEKDSTKTVLLRSTPSSNTILTKSSAGKTGDALQVTIYTDKYREDARYLEASLKAVRTYLQRDVIVRTVFTADSMAKTGWLFWLSEQTPPAGHKTLLRYAPGKPVNVVTSMGHIKFYKRIPAKDSLITDWQDAAGNTILGHVGNVYTYYSHFHPSYTNLVWEDDFPVMVLQLLEPDTFRLQHDKRAIAQSQLLPAKGRVAGKGAVFQEEMPLWPYCWLLLFIFFCLERWMVFRPKTVQS